MIAGGCLSGKVIVIGWGTCWDTVCKDCCEYEVSVAAVLW